MILLNKFQGLGLVQGCSSLLEVALASRDLLGGYEEDITASRRPLVSYLAYEK